MNQSKRQKKAFTLTNAGDLLQGLNGIKKARNWKAIYNDLKEAAQVKAPVQVAIKATIETNVKKPIFNPVGMAAIFSRNWLGAEIAYKFEGFENVYK